jgi:hypothetical protein
MPSGSLASDANSLYAAPVRPRTEGMEMPRFKITVTETPQYEEPKGSCQPGSCQPSSCQPPPQLCACVGPDSSFCTTGKVEAPISGPEEISPLSD